MFSTEALDLFSASLALTLKAVIEQTEEAYAEASDAYKACEAWEASQEA